MSRPQVRAISVANLPSPAGGFVVITRNRVPAPPAGLGKFATLMARTCGRDTDSAAFEYYLPELPGNRR